MRKTDKTPSTFARANALALAAECARDVIEIEQAAIRAYLAKVAPTK